MVQAERAQADSGVRLLERWTQGTVADATRTPLSIGKIADLLGVTRDMLRNWERNNLICVSRSPGNGSRRYGATEISRQRVIRMLRQAGYSTMAILRMLVRLDEGAGFGDLRTALDTPRPDEAVSAAADQRLTSLVGWERRGEDHRASGRDDWEAAVSFQRSASRK